MEVQVLSSAPYWSISHIYGIITSYFKGLQNIAKPNNYPVQPESEAELIGNIATSIDRIMLETKDEDLLFRKGAPISFSGPDRPERIFTDGLLRSTVNLAFATKYDLPEISHEVQYMYNGGSAGVMLLVDSSPNNPHGTVIIPSDNVRRRATANELREVFNDLMLSLGSGTEQYAHERPSISSDPEQKERYWSLEQSAAAVEALVEIDPAIAHEVVRLAGGSIGVIRAIKEKLADEVSYEPGQPLTPDSIRAIVDAPSDEGLVEDWRKTFYEPYRQKYRAERRS